MNNFESLMENTQFLKGLLITNAVLIIIVIALIIYVVYLSKKYLKFMEKLGNGNNLDEMLKNYICMKFYK